MYPYIRVGDRVLLKGGHSSKVTEIVETDFAVLEDGQRIQFQFLKLYELTPAHLAIYLFNVNGREAVIAWKWDGSITELLSDLDGFLRRHTKIETILTITNTERYSWQDGGFKRLEEAALQVLSQLEKLINETEPPAWRVANKPLE